MKEKIIREATILFSENGSDFSLNDLAKKIGMKKQSLYYYFESKDELLSEIIQVEVSNYFGVAKEEFAKLEKLNSENALKSIFLYIVNYFKDLNKLRFWRWLLLIDSEKIYTKTKQRIHENEKRFIFFINNIFEKGVNNKELKSLDYKDILRTYLALIHGTLDVMLFYNDFIKAEELVDSVWKVFWNNIKAD